MISLKPRLTTKGIRLLKSKSCSSKKLVFRNSMNRCSRLLTDMKKDCVRKKKRLREIWKRGCLGLSRRRTVSKLSMSRRGRRIRSWKGVFS
jgi:cAMP phosphodiesterase